MGNGRVEEWCYGRTDRSERGGGEFAGYTEFNPCYFIAIYLFVINCDNNHFCQHVSANILRREA